jgi:hypothetical protein
VSRAEPVAASRAESAVALPAKLNVGADTLQLNGRGIRTRFLIKIYEAGLYTAKPVRSADDLARLEGAKRWHAVALREFDSETVGTLFIKGIRENHSREEASRLTPALVQISTLFNQRRKIKTGDSFGFDYLPGQGTRLMINGDMQGEWVKDPTFFPAVMRIWLGSQPVDADLKQALLGLPPLRANTTMEP